MEEVKRFFKSINFEYRSDFDKASIKKVLLNKREKAFNVYIQNDKVLNYKLVNELIEASKNGINGDNLCNIFIVYNDILEEDLAQYINKFLEILVFEHPSLMGLISTFKKLSDKTLIFEVGTELEKHNLIKNSESLFIFLNRYFLGTYEIDVKVNKEIQESVKKDIALSSRPKKTKVDFDSNILLGTHKDGEVTEIRNILGEMKNIILEGYIFSIENSERKGQKATAYIINLKISDNTDSFLVKIVRFDQSEYLRIIKNVKEKKWIRIYGNSELDNYMHQIIFNCKGIELIPSKEEQIVDNAKEKRVELHIHTKMSAMDGVVDPKELLKFVSSLGHKALAVTDHNCLQAFPDLYHAVCELNKGKKEEDKFKVIYGTELNVVNNTTDIIYNLKDYNLLEDEFVVFDTETTGLTPYHDQMIEIGAVKIKNGEVIARFDELINPHRELNEKIVSLTSITDEMLIDKDEEENVTKRFMDFVKDLPMVAHNAKFDIGFIEAAFNKYNMGKFTNTVLDTMSMARMLFPTWKNHKLSTLVKNLEVPWSESEHHRADYDSEGTATCFYKMSSFLDKRNIETTINLYDSVDQEELMKFARPIHMSILVKNKIGLKNLFKIISYANTKYLYKKEEPKLPKRELDLYRSGLLIGSGCVNGEIFNSAFLKEDEELAKIMQYYDYIEVQPPECYTFLMNREGSRINSLADILTHIAKIVKVAHEAGVVVVADGDVHHLKKEDKIYREIIINQKTGGKIHPLNRSGMIVPDMHFYTTDEMLQAFSFLGEDLAHEIVITNPNKIASQCEIVEVIIETGGIPFSPKIENSKEIVENMVYERAHELYGEKLPEIVENRIDQELKGIIGGGFDVIYLIAQKLVKKSNEDGFLVGSRGSVGSSFVATMMGITEVNPLPSHYRCPKCKLSIFKNDNQEELSKEYGIGFDLPDFHCPHCKILMTKDGEDMPFATFLGFNADKVPDIDLNFSDLNQAATHEYTKKLFGVDNVYRAGTIGTVAEKTAFGFVKGYCEQKNIIMRNIEIERLSKGCVGVKRTTGQHPGGIVVIPDYMEVFDFTPYQYPAEDVDASWRTTHFDYHAIDQDVLKLDILGHTDPTQLRMLQDLTGIDVKTIPFDDKETMGIFLSPKPLGVTKEKIMCETGTLGVPEFGTPFTISMLRDTKPNTFAELIKISGLSHGTDVWLSNAQELIKKKIVPFKEVIGCRDDIMVYLIQNGVSSLEAFKIMEFVRKGKASKDPESWEHHKEIMVNANIPDWYIASCEKIKYMFPKAHAAAYVMSAFRIAWFKVHYPASYYASYFSTRFDDFEIEVMINGYDAIKKKIIEIINKGYDATNKETSVLETLKLSLEATARGFNFGNIDIEKSDAKNFLISSDGKTLIPPFRTIDGLGENVANQIILAREKKPFYCIEDLQTRGRVNQTTLEKLRALGVLKGLPESSQLSLF